MTGSVERPESHVLMLGNKRIVIYAENVSIGLWTRMLEAIEAEKDSDTRQQSAHAIMQVVAAALGEQADDVSVLYMSLVVPRVLQVVADSVYLNSQDMDDEIEEIMRRLQSTDE